VSYTATESAGSQPICASVREPSNISIELEFNLSIKPVNGTAGQILIDPNTAVITILDDDNDTSAITTSATTIGPTSLPMPQNDLQTILLAILVPTAVLIVLIIAVGVAIMCLKVRRKLNSKFTPQMELPSEEDINVYAGWFCIPMSSFALTS